MMSEFLDAAAQAVGAPAELVLRSAEARARADGMSVDDVLSAWAGGGSPPAPAPAVETPPSPEPSSAPPSETPAAAAASPTPSPPPPEPAAAPVSPVEAPTVVVSVEAPSGPPPVLVGRVDRPFRYLLGGAALLILCLAVTLVAPAFSGTGRGAFHSEIRYSAAALVGQDEYLAQGCASCHTQVVRPIVADAQLAAMAGLGGVTLSDTNQVIGRQRYGPDLANVGNRMTPEDIEGVLSGDKGHIAYGGGDMAALVAYLVESRVSTEGVDSE